MSFTWHGRDEDTVWEQEITRYYFVSNVTVTTLHRYTEGDVIALKVGDRIKLTKSEARKYIKQGFVQYNVRSWNPIINEFEIVHHQLRDGYLAKDVEVRYLKQSLVQPDELIKARKSKK